MPTTIINFLLFQIGWFACVIGAAYQFPWQGTLVAILIVAYHVLRSNYPSRELGLIVVAVIIGAIWDSLLVWMQMLSYTSGMWSPVFAPYWIIALWALFATTLNVSLRWLKGRRLVALVSGAIAGPLAYYAGYRIGAVHFNEMTEALLLLGVGWAFFTPILLMLAQRLDGYAQLTNPERVAP
jgi:hypothetical protein